MSAPPGSAVSALGASVRHNAAVAPVAPSTNDQPIFFGVLAIVIIGALKVLLRRRLAHRHSVSLDLVMVVIGFVLLLMMRLPLRGTSGLIGLALFLGLAGLYKLLGFFEEPPEKQIEKQPDQQTEKQTGKQ
jgi:hypothetical protein